MQRLRRLLCVVIAFFLLILGDLILRISLKEQLCLLYTHHRVVCSTHRSILIFNPLNKKKLRFKVQHSIQGLVPLAHNLGILYRGENDLTCYSYHGSYIGKIRPPHAVSLNYGAWAQYNLGWVYGDWQDATIWIKKEHGSWKKIPIKSSHPHFIQLACENQKIVLLAVKPPEMLFVSLAGQVLQKISLSKKNFPFLGRAMFRHFWNYIYFEKPTIPMIFGMCGHHQFGVVFRSHNASYRRLIKFTKVNTSIQAHEIFMPFESVKNHRRVCPAGICGSKSNFWIISTRGGLWEGKRNWLIKKICNLKSSSKWDQVIHSNWTLGLLILGFAFSLSVFLLRNYLGCSWGDLKIIFLSLIFPGLGHFLTGKIQWGILWMSLEGFWLSIFVFLLEKLKDSLFVSFDVIIEVLFFCIFIWIVAASHLLVNYFRRGKHVL